MCVWCMCMCVFVSVCVRVCVHVCVWYISSGKVLKLDYPKFSNFKLVRNTILIVFVCVCGVCVCVCVRARVCVCVCVCVWYISSGKVLKLDYPKFSNFKLFRNTILILFHTMLIDGSTGEEAGHSILSP